VDALAAALDQAVNNDLLRADLTNRGLKRARQFKWATSAAQLVDVYRRLAA
jgi:glycosyltransferase involved in cell wall biosynthesis